MEGTFIQRPKQVWAYTHIQPSAAKSPSGFHQAFMCIGMCHALCGWVSEDVCLGLALLKFFSAPWDFWIRSAPRRFGRASRFALPRLGPASAPRSHGACPIYASTHAQCGMELFQGCRLRNECLRGPSHTRASSALVSRPFFLLGPTASLLPSSSSL